MKHYLFSGGESQEEIKRILADNCSGSETMSFTKQLTEEELQDLRESYVNNNIEKQKLGEALQAAKDTYKEEMKPLKVEAIETLKVLKTRHREVDAITYKMPNYETGMMEFVDETGEIVHTRKLKPDEKQGNIFSIGRAANG